MRPYFNQKNGVLADNAGSNPAGRSCFTLIEVLLTLIIILILFASVIVYFKDINTSYDTIDGFKDLHNYLRYSSEVYGTNIILIGDNKLLYNNELVNKLNDNAEFMGKIIYYPDGFCVGTMTIFKGTNVFNVILDGLGRVKT